MKEFSRPSPIVSNNLAFFERVSTRHALPVGLNLNQERVRFRSDSPDRNRRGAPSGFDATRHQDRDVAALLRSNRH
jgi:hypothetical protein